MAEWTATPQQFEGRPDDPFRRLLERIDAAEVNLRDMRSNVLKMAGISIEPDRVRFLGDVKIEGTLDLPAGIIGNDALANPIVYDSTWNSASGFALAGSWTPYTTATITVPAGFTKMQFVAVGTVEGRNDSGGTQYLLTAIKRVVDGGPTFSSVETRATVPDLYRSTGFVPYVWGEAVSPGEVHEFSLEAWVGGGGWSADAGHYARLEVSATFSR